MSSCLRYSVLIWLCILFHSCESIYKPGEVKEAPARLVENFGADWFFKRVMDTLPHSDQWEPVFLPHSVRIEPLVVNDQWQGTALYKKDFEVQKTGKKWFFHFEGVMQEAWVRINDSLVQIHKGGYLPFTVDATPFLRKGTNTIEVKVVNVDDPKIPPGKALKDLDFNLFGGIYRDVYLVRTNPLYITQAVQAKQTKGGGILLHFDDVSETAALGTLSTRLQNDSGTSREVQVLSSFQAPNGRSYSFLSEPVNIAPGDDPVVMQKITIEEPELWSPQHPNLYDLKVQILEGGNVIDEKALRSGIRELQLTATNFYLNREAVFLNGTNRHQEYPYVGYALPDEAHYRDAYKIKQAGFNFVRLSHYPHDPAFLEACDELGLMVMNAIPGWQYFEEGEFSDNSIQDIRDMARRDRNHPSVIFWENSLNESPMTEKYMIAANAALEAELPFRDTYSAGWIDHPSYDLFIPARQHAKPPHYWNRYDGKNKPILIAEYGDWEYYAQNAGFNQKAFHNLQEEQRNSRQLRGHGEQALLQQALNFQESANSNRKGEQTVGMANWLMFDYNRGYADDLEASGIADIFRLPKFSYYFYQSQKSPELSEPMVFVANYWQPQSTTKVTVFSNTEEVALYLNEELIDKKAPLRDELSSHLKHPPFQFQVPQYKAGKLKAVGFIGGEPVTTHTVETPGAATSIELSIDLSGKPIARNAPDLVFVYAKVLDEKGQLIPTAKPDVEFHLETVNEGAELIGNNPVKAEAGIATILLRTKFLKGPIRLEAHAEKLTKDVIIIK